jgi:hypothetical protein
MNKLGVPKYTVNKVQVKAINLGTGDNSKTTMIGAGLDPK